MLLARSDPAKDVEILVLSHEVARGPHALTSTAKITPECPSRGMPGQLLAEITSCEHERGKRGRKPWRPRGLRCCMGDGGCLALRSRLAEEGFKPPRGALAEDRRLERRGKRRGRTTSGMDREDER